MLTVLSLDLDIGTVSFLFTFVTYHYLSVELSLLLGHLANNFHFFNYLITKNRTDITVGNCIMKLGFDASKSNKLLNKTIF